MPDAPAPSSSTTSTPEAPTPMSTGKMVAVVACMLGVPLVFVGGYTLLVEGAKSEVSGTLRLGEETLQIDRCESGVLSEDAPRTRPQWHGVDLFASADPTRRVRLIDDPEKGKLITLRRGDEAPVAVDRATCAGFHVELRETGTMLLDHHGLEGSIDVDCPAIVGKLAFASCYDGT